MRTSQPRYVSLGHGLRPQSTSNELYYLQAVRTGLADVQRVLAGNGSEAEKAEARIEADVYESLQYALGTK